MSHKKKKDLSLEELLKKEEKRAKKLEKQQKKEQKRAEKEQKKLEKKQQKLLAKEQKKAEKMRKKEEKKRLKHEKKQNKTEKTIKPVKEEKLQNESQINNDDTVAKITISDAVTLPVKKRTAVRTPKVSTTGKTENVVVRKPRKASEKNG